MAGHKQILTFDDEYRTEVEKAYAEYLVRLSEADSIMSTISVEEWADRILSGQDPIPHTTEYEKLARQELDLKLKLAGVRLRMRRLLRASRLTQRDIMEGLGESHTPT